MTIRVGIGGWTYAPWRGSFYPDGLRQVDELAYAASRLGAIEINGTYYRLQKRETFVKWAKAAPLGFKYSVKASRYCTNRQTLADAGESIDRFFAQGVAELGDKLGPILWQFAPTKLFEPDDFASFLDILPAKVEGVALSHAVEVRHESFACASFVELARERGVAIVIADHDAYPQIADLSADFVYARLMRSRAEVATGYPPDELNQWARCMKSWNAGHAPDGLAYINKRASAKQSGRETYVFFINGAKERAPAGARALIAEVA